MGISKDKKFEDEVFRTNDKQFLKIKRERNALFRESRGLKHKLTRGPIEALKKISRATLKSKKNDFEYPIKY